MEYENKEIDKIIKDFKPKFGNYKHIQLLKVITAYKKMKVYLDLGRDDKKKQELKQSISVHEDLIKKLYKKENT